MLCICLCYGASPLSLHCAIFGRVLCAVRGCHMPSGGGAARGERKSTLHCCSGGKIYTGLEHIGVNLPNLQQLPQIFMNGIGFAVLSCI